MDPRPDVLVHTGDVADHGVPEEYAEAVAVLSAWEGPMVVCPGNHDVRTPYVDAFLAGASGASRGWANRSHSVGGARFLMLDSLVDELDGVRQDHGVLAREQLAWLDAELSWDPRPTFVCLHHPPVAIGVSLMDPIMLTEPDALAEVIGRHPHVVATLVGHAHTMGGLLVRGPPRARRRRRGLHRAARPGGAPRRLVRRLPELRDPPAPRRRPPDHPLARGLNPVELRGALAPRSRDRRGFGVEAMNAPLLNQREVGSLASCCWPSTPPPPTSPSRCTTVSRSWPRRARSSG